MSEEPINRDWTFGRILYIAFGMMLALCLFVLGLALLFTHFPETEGWRVTIVAALLFGIVGLSAGMVAISKLGMSKR